MRLFIFHLDFQQFHRDIRKYEHKAAGDSLQFAGKHALLAGSALVAASINLGSDRICSRRLVGYSDYAGEQTLKKLCNDTEKVDIRYAEHLQSQSLPCSRWLWMCENVWQLAIR